MGDGTIDGHCVADVLLQLDAGSPDLTVFASDRSGHSDQRTKEDRERFDEFV